jgi:hypothetical protein
VDHPLLVYHPASCHRLIRDKKLRPEMRLMHSSPLRPQAGQRVGTQGGVQGAGLDIAKYAFLDAHRGHVQGRDRQRADQKREGAGAFRQLPALPNCD